MSDMRISSKIKIASNMRGLRITVDSNNQEYNLYSCNTPNRV